MNSLPRARLGASGDYAGTACDEGVLQRKFGKRPARDDLPVTTTARYASSRRQQVRCANPLGSTPEDHLCGVSEPGRQSSTVSRALLFEFAGMSCIITSCGFSCFPFSGRLGQQACESPQTPGRLNISMLANPWFVPGLSLIATTSSPKSCVSLCHRAVDFKNDDKNFRPSPATCSANQYTVGQDTASSKATIRHTVDMRFLLLVNIWSTGVPAHPVYTKGFSYRTGPSADLVHLLAFSEAENWYGV